MISTLDPPFYCRHKLTLICTNLSKLNDPRICNGKPVIFGTRISVTVVLDQLADSGSIENVIRKYLELSLAQVTAVLKYCHSVIEHTELEVVL